MVWAFDCLFVGGQVSLRASVLIQSHTMDATQEAIERVWASPTMNQSQKKSTVNIIVCNAKALSQKHSIELHRFSADSVASNSWSDTSADFEHEGLAQRFGGNQSADENPRVVSGPLSQFSSPAVRGAAALESNAQEVVMVAEGVRLDVARASGVPCATLHNAVGVLKRSGLVDTQFLKKLNLVNHAYTGIHHCDTSMLQSLTGEVAGILGQLGQHSNE